MKDVAGPLLHVIANWNIRLWWSSVKVYVPDRHISYAPIKQVDFMDSIDWRRPIIGIHILIKGAFPQHHTCLKIGPV